MCLDFLKMPLKLKRRTNAKLNLCFLEFFDVFLQVMWYKKIICLDHVPKNKFWIKICGIVTIVYTVVFPILIYDAYSIVDQ